MNKRYVFHGSKAWRTSKQHWAHVQWTLRFGLWRGSSKRIPGSSWYILPDSLVRIDRQFFGSPHRWVYEFEEGAKASYLEMILFNQQPQEETDEL